MPLHLPGRQARTKIQVFFFIFFPIIADKLEPDLEKVVDPANLVRRKYSKKPGLAENN